MNTKIIYIIAGIFVIASLGYALDSWNEFGTDGVQNGDILTAGMLNTLFHNVKNLTDIMHSEGDVLNVSGRIKAADPIDNDDIVTKGWVLTNAAGGGGITQAQILLPSDQNPGALHSAQDCLSVGGNFALVDSKYYCKFSGTSCPSGWTRYKNHYAQRTCGAQYCNGDSGTGCTTPDAWGLTYPSCTYHTADWTAAPCGLKSETCTANSIVDVSCY